MNKQKSYNVGMKVVKAQINKYPNDPKREGHKLDVLVPIRKRGKTNTNSAPKWFTSWVKNQYEIDVQHINSRFDNLVKVNNLKE
ncbi:MAG: hypothetical protein LBJ97_04130 [Mycoplasmataceae bacterium]|nr:hypothetical protein [Mycoplasmataceae bacterium]